MPCVGITFVQALEQNILLKIFKFQVVEDRRHSSSKESLLMIFYPHEIKNIFVFRLDDVTFIYFPHERNPHVMINDKQTNTILYICEIASLTR